MNYSYQKIMKRDCKIKEEIIKILTLNAENTFKA